MSETNPPVPPIPVQQWLDGIAALLGSIAETITFKLSTMKELLMSATISGASAQIATLATDIASLTTAVNSLTAGYTALQAQINGNSNLDPADAASLNDSINQILSDTAAAVQAVAPAQTSGTSGTVTSGGSATPVS